MNEVLGHNMRLRPTRPEGAVRWAAEPPPKKGAGGGARSVQKEVYSLEAMLQDLKASRVSLPLGVTPSRIRREVSELVSLTKEIQDGDAQFRSKVEVLLQQLLRKKGLDGLLSLQAAWRRSSAGAGSGHAEVEEDGDGQDVETAEETSQQAAPREDAAKQLLNMVLKAAGKKLRDREGDEDTVEGEAGNVHFEIVQASSMSELFSQLVQQGAAGGGAPQVQLQFATIDPEGENGGTIELADGGNLAEMLKAMFNKGGASGDADEEESSQKKVIFKPITGRATKGAAKGGAAGAAADIADAEELPLGAGLDLSDLELGEEVIAGDELQAKLIELFGEEAAAELNEAVAELHAGQAKQVAGSGEDSDDDDEL